MTHEIWADIDARMKNIRADMVGQWQGDFENVAIERSVGSLGATIQMWQLAEPPTAPIPPQVIP